MIKKFKTQINNKIVIESNIYKTSHYLRVNARTRLREREAPLIVGCFFVSFRLFNKISTLFLITFNLTQHWIF